MNALDEFISAFNGVVLVGMSTLFSWFVLDCRFKTGVVLTAGLSLAAIGAGTLGAWHLVGIDAYNVSKTERAAALLNIGVLVVLAGYLYQELCQMAGDTEQPQQHAEEREAGNGG